MLEKIRECDERGRVQYLSDCKITRGRKGGPLCANNLGWYTYSGGGPWSWEKLNGVVTLRIKLCMLAYLAHCRVQSLHNERSV